MLLGDALGLLKGLRRKSTLRTAFRYAMRDRHKDWFYDPFEMDWVTRNEDAIIKALTQELKDAVNYEFKPAYAYFPPKTADCYRRMIYIPFKDLVVRYAFAIVVADLVDADLSAKCFANRRNRDPEVDRFLQDFASISWPAFCEWQRTSRDNGTYTTLMRTDISAFYDSISHEYLIADVASSLKVPTRSRLMQLFKRLLRVPVVSYCHRTRKQRGPDKMFQGLSIGNSTEGLYANIYLTAIDRYMEGFKGIAFGRYNDDMRVFAKDRATAKRAMLALQARLLTKGLNLNSSKTEFAEGAVDVEKLRSKSYELDDYTDDDESPSEVRPRVTDRPFDQFNRDFRPGQPFQEAKDPKEFCHFLGKRLGISERQPEHVRMLRTILTEWHGSARHAAWRLVESIVRRECPHQTRLLAESTVLECLTDKNVTDYSKYRLLHHLVRGRQASEKENSNVYRYSELLKPSTIRELKRLLPKFLAKPAFELNIIALYAMKVLGSSIGDLERVVDEHAAKPVPLPIRNALSYARQPSKAKVFPAYVPAGDEETEIDDNY